MNWFYRSAVKGFGIERFKGNCVKATEGFNIVLQHFQDQQCHLRKIRVQKWQEMRDKGELLREKISLNSKECWKHLSSKDKYPLLHTAGFWLLYYSFTIPRSTIVLNWRIKVHICWEGHKIWQNLHLTFDRHYTRLVYT